MFLCFTYFIASSNSPGQPTGDTIYKCHWPFPSKHTEKKMTDKRNQWYIIKIHFYHKCTQAALLLSQSLFVSIGFPRKSLQIPKESNLCHLALIALINIFTWKFDLSPSIIVMLLNLSFVFLNLPCLAISPVIEFPVVFPSAWKVVLFTLYALFLPSYTVVPREPATHCAKYT